MVNGSRSQSVSCRFAYFHCMCRGWNNGTRFLSISQVFSSGRLPAPRKRSIADGTHRWKKVQLIYISRLRSHQNPKSMIISKWGPRIYPMTCRARQTTMGGEPRIMTRAKPTWVDGVPLLSLGDPFPSEIPKKTPFLPSRSNKGNKTSPNFFKSVLIQITQWGWFKIDVGERQNSSNKYCYWKLRYFPKPKSVAAWLSLGNAMFENPKKNYIKINANFERFIDHLRS